MKTTIDHKHQNDLTIRGQSVAKLTLLTLAVMVPAVSFAAGFTLPFVTGIGCDILNWMKGELAIIVFLVVTVTTIVIGMFARMDWAKILSIVVLYGVIQGLVGLLASTGYMQLPSCFK